MFAKREKRPKTDILAYVRILGCKDTKYIPYTQIKVRMRAKKAFFLTFLGIGFGGMRYFL